MDNRTYFGDCRASMRRLINDGVKVQMCVTSPPYFGLRDYSVEGQLGLEETPEAFVNNLVEVFTLVRELLADDGTLWLNLGDSYSVQHVGRRDHGTGEKTSRLGPNKNGIPGGTEIKATANRLVVGLKPKDIIGIPWRVAFALQADGWYLRQDIIWHKNNPMPESVTDRCTKAHEYLFLLSKSPRYYFDNDAIKEDAKYGEHHARYSGTYTRHKIEAMQQEGAVNGKNYQRGLCQGMKDPLKKNRRSVWTVNPKPYRGAHFATFPPALIEPCVLAGSRPGDIVLDPFMGSGTTGEVAQQHGRRWIGCELNVAYAALQQQRTGVCMDEYVWEYVTNG